MRLQGMADTLLTDMSGHVTSCHVTHVNINTQMPCKSMTQDERTMGVKIKSELSTQIEAGFDQELSICFHLEEIHSMTSRT